MASAWYPTTGLPADTIGADGDFARDAIARIDYGPKGRVTAGSWAGTAIAINGPTGPSILSGSGAPGSSLGNNGQSYFDAVAGTTYLKSSNAWAAAGTVIGPQGVPGPITLTSQSATTGPTVGLIGNTLSATPTPLTFIGSTQVQTISFGFGSALMGGMFTNNSGAAVVFNLVDLAAGTTLFSQSVAANSLVTAGQFTTAQYLMPQGRSYQWQVTGTAAVTGIYVVPYYLFPSVTPAYSVGALAFCGRPQTNATYGGTYNSLYVGATGTTNYSLTFRKPCSLYYVTCYNQTNAALTFGMANFTANNFLWQQSVPANTTQSFGPFAIGTYAFTSGSTYYWSASGTGTGAAYVDGQVIFSAA